MDTKRKFGYAGLAAIAIGAGFTHGYCSAKGIDMATGLEPALTYGTPIITTATGFCIGIETIQNYGDRRDLIIKSLNSSFGAGLGGAIGLVGSLVGYGIGSLQ